MLGRDIYIFFRVVNNVIKFHFSCYTIEVEFVMILANATLDIVDCFVANVIVSICFANT